MQYPGANLEINDSTFDLKQAPDNDRLGIFYAGFIRKVYGILSAQLLVTIFFCAIVMSSEILTEFVQENLAFFFIAIFGVFSSMIALMCCKDVAREVPKNYIILFIFTLCESYMVATVCTLYEAYTVITAAIMTLGVTLALTAYACLTKTDFRPLVGVMFIALSSMIMMLFFGLYRMGDNFEVIWCSLGVIIYGIYIIIDTQLIVDGEKYGITSDDYVIGAMLIYVDVIALFIRILELIGKLKDS